MIVVKTVSLLIVLVAAWIVYKFFTFFIIPVLIAFIAGMIIGVVLARRK